MSMDMTEDGSLLEDGQIVYFSVARFVQEVCQAGHCFLCGAAPKELAFEQEHVIPEWLLRKHNLFDLKIGVPNGGGLHYPRYKDIRVGYVILLKKGVSINMLERLHHHPVRHRLPTEPAAPKRRKGQMGSSKLPSFTGWHRLETMSDGSRPSPVRRASR
jgi:hypothetical protein